MSFRERKIREETAFEGGFLHVARYEVELPNGNRAMREVVHHPGAVCAVVVNSLGQVAMVKQHRFALGVDFWEIPAGKIDKGENPETAIRRELREEIGCMDGTVLPLVEFATAPGFCDEILYCYAVQDPILSDPEPDDDELLEVAWFSLDQVVQNQLKSKPCDAKTLTALFAYKERFLK